MPNLLERHNVHISGKGETALLFVHGLGCDQSMWRFVAPEFEDRARVVRMDLMGFGRSHQERWSASAYEGLEGHAHDVAAVAERIGGPVVLIGHSVSAMLGVLADLHAPWAITAHAMVAPSPCYREERDYSGGFQPEVLEQTLELIASDVRAWTEAMMPLLLNPMPDHPHAEELTGSFCRAHPHALVQLARATFRSDLRPLLPSLTKPTLVIQSDDDLIAPRAVGQYMFDVMRDCSLRVIRNQGHCPHLTNPQACVGAISEFLSGLDLIKRPVEVQQSLAHA